MKYSVVNFLHQLLSLAEGIIRKLLLPVSNMCDEEAVAQEELVAINRTCLELDEELDEELDPKAYLACYMRPIEAYAQSSKT